MFFRVQDNTNVHHKREIPADLAEYPREWFRVVEPRIQRNPRRFSECWIWQGAKTNEGEPKIDVINDQKTFGNRRTTQLLKYLVCGWFVDLMHLGTPNRHYTVVHICGVRNCLNPKHLMLRFDHHTQRDLEAIRKKELHPGEYYTP